VKDEISDLLADSHDILNRWKNYFSQLLNIHRASDVRQIEIHTAEPLVPGTNPFEVEIAIANLKSYKLPDTDHIPAELRLIQINPKARNTTIKRLKNRSSCRRHSATA
jgi:hypothetical protein